MIGTTKNDRIPFIIQSVSDFVFVTRIVIHEIVERDCPVKLYLPTSSLGYFIFMCYDHRYFVTRKYFWSHLLDLTSLFMGALGTREITRRFFSTAIAL